MTAWEKWHALDDAERRYRRELDRIGRELDYLWEATTIALARELAENPHYRKVVKRFFGRTQRGWEVACGTDRGLWKKTLRFGWDRTFEAIALSRRMATWR